MVSRGHGKISTAFQRPCGGVHAPFRASTNDRNVIHMTNITSFDENIVADVRFARRRDVFLQRCQDARTMRGSTQLCVCSLKYFSSCVGNSFQRLDSVVLAQIQAETSDAAWTQEEGFHFSNQQEACGEARLGVVDIRLR